MRPQLQTIALTSAPPGARVEVQLGLPGHGDLRGEGEGSATELGQATAAAEATVRALGEVLPDVRLTVDEVVAQAGSDATWVTVLVTAMGRSGVERLVGSALVEAGMHRAAVHATLHACNRRLLHLGVAPPEVVPVTPPDADTAASRSGVRDAAAVLLGYLRVLRRHADELTAPARLTLLDRSIVAADRLVAAADPDVPPRPAPPAAHTSSVHGAVTRALADVPSTAGVVVADCPADLHAVTDPQDLHRMLRAALEALLHHGTHPVTLRADAADGWVRIEVRGAGGAPPPDRDLRHAMRTGRDPGPGLELLRLLAETNGGTARVEADGAHVHAVRLHLPRRVSPSSVPPV